MMWAVLLMLLCVVFLVVIWWKPNKSNGPAVIQSAMDRIVSRPSTPLEQEIEIIASALRERDTAKRKAEALARLKDLLAEE
jgi:hypothetical protein